MPSPYQNVNIDFKLLESPISVIDLDYINPLYCLYSLYRNLQIHFVFKYSTQNNGSTRKIIERDKDTSESQLR